MSQPSNYKFCWNCKTVGVPYGDDNLCGNCSMYGEMVSIPYPHKNTIIEIGIKTKDSYDGHPEHIPVRKEIYQEKNAKRHLL